MTARRGVKVTAQRKDWDCGVACLAMLLDRPYGDVAAFVRDWIDPLSLRRRGMTIRNVQFVAWAFDVELVAHRRKAGYLDGRTGILGVIGGAMDKAGHWVILKNGTTIVDPDGSEVWTVDDYMHKHKSRPVTLLVEAQ